MDQAFGPNTRRMSNSCQRFHTDPNNKSKFYILSDSGTLQNTYRVQSLTLLPAGHDKIRLAT